MRIVAALVVLFCTTICSPAEGTSSVQFEKSATRVLTRWIRAIDRSEYAAYLGALDVETRKSETLGTRQAMRRWKDQLESWREASFEGAFKYVLVHTASDGLPAGSVRAYPVLGSVIGSPLLLVPEAGGLRLSMVQPADESSGQSPLSE